MDSGHSPFVEVRGQLSDVGSFHPVGSPVGGNRIYQLSHLAEPDKVF